MGDLLRVLWPVAMIDSSAGSNFTNGWFMLFAFLYVFDTTLYFIVYNSWEREAIEAEEAAAAVDEWRATEAAHQQRQEEGEGQALYDSDGAHTDGEGDDEHKSMLRASAGAGGGGGKARYKAPAPHPSSSSSPPMDFTTRLLVSGSIALRARWCLFSHEGGLVNVMEILGSLIVATGATMGFFVGILDAPVPVQVRWDRVEMVCDVVAAAIFLADSIVFMHLYTRQLQSAPESGEGHRAAMSVSPRDALSTPRFGAFVGDAARATVSCLQPRDPYFHSALLNVLGSALYFCAACWGCVRQHAIAALEELFPDSYNKNMLPMLHKLHIMYFISDIL